MWRCWRGGRSFFRNVTGGALAVGHYLRKMILDLKMGKITCVVTRMKASADVPSRLSPGDIFIVEIGAGGFLQPHWIKIQLMEGKRPF
jgi:hypothetical protein